MKKNPNIWTYSQRKSWTRRRNIHMISIY